MQALTSYLHGFLILCAVLFALFSASCQASPSVVSSFDVNSFLGSRFRCNDPKWVTACLKVLRESCSLSIAPGRGIPRKSGDKLVLIHGDQARIVTRPADLAKCVDIGSEEDALEYLRFFSSFETVYLFDEAELEVYEGECFAVCLPSERWKALKLSPPVMVAKDNAFEVSRFVFKPTANKPEVQLFRVRERVGRDGEILTLESEPIPMSWEDRIKLRFPQFM